VQLELVPFHGVVSQAHGVTFALFVASVIVPLLLLLAPLLDRAGIILALPDNDMPAERAIIEGVGPASTKLGCAVRGQTRQLGSVGHRFSRQRDLVTSFILVQFNLHTVLLSLLCPPSSLW
jgi:hypothetical protein